MKKRLTKKAILQKKVDLIKRVKAGFLLVAVIFSMSGFFVVVPQALAKVGPPALPNLTAVKTNNVGGNSSVGSTFIWTIRIQNSGDSDANFPSNKEILKDEMPDTNVGTYTVVASPVTFGGITGIIDCTVTGGGAIHPDLKCKSSGAVKMPAGSYFDAVVTVSPTAVGALNNPRSGKTCEVDKGNDVSESNEGDNSCSNSVIVGVADITAPVITETPLDKLEEAIAPGGAIIAYASPTAVDAVDGSRPVSCLPASGSAFPLGTNIVTCSASDLSGNTASTNFNITVVDTSSPNITINGETEMTIEKGSTYVENHATWIDAVDGTGLANESGEVNANTVGTYEVKYNYTDGAGNVASEATRTIEVVDTTAPEIYVDPFDNITPTNQDITVTASTDEDGVLNETSHIFIENGSFTFISTDASGNSSETEVVITNIDQTAPNTGATGLYSDEEEYKEGAWVDSNVQVTLSCADIDGSGCAQTYYLINGQGNGESPYFSYDGSFTISEYSVITYWSHDNAGNVEEQKTFTVKRTASGPEGIGGAWEFPEGSSPENAESVVLHNNLTVTITNADGSVSTVFLPAGTVITKSDGSNLNLSVLTSGEISEGLSGFESWQVIEGAIQFGIPSIGLSFSKSITIRIFVGEDLNGQTLNIVRSTSNSSGWTSEGIVSPTCVVTAGYCEFNATKASYYSTTSGSAPVTTSSPVSSGGFGSISYCIEVIYGEWKDCVNDIQYRDVLSQGSYSCSLTASQQALRSRSCGAGAEQQVLGEKKYAEGTILRGPDNKIYIVVDGQLLYIANLRELAKYIGKEIIKVDDSVISSFLKKMVLGIKKYVEGTLLRGSNNKIYVVVSGGKLKHIVNLKELAKYIGKEIIKVDDSVIDEYLK